MARKKVQPEEQMDTALDTGLTNPDNEIAVENPSSTLPGEETPVLLLPDDTGDEGEQTPTEDEPQALEAAPEEKPKRSRSTKTKKAKTSRRKHRNRLPRHLMTRMMR